MDDKFKRETKRLAEVAKNLRPKLLKSVGAADVPAERLRTCPRCGDIRVTLNDKCETCGLPIKSWG